MNLPLGHDTDIDGPGKPRLLSFIEGVKERMKESRYHSGAIWFTYSEVDSHESKLGPGPPATKKPTQSSLCRNG